MPYKLAVVTEPEFDNWDLLKRTIDKYREQYGARLHLNAASDSRLLIRYVRGIDVSYTDFYCNWSKHGRMAAHKRNAFMVYCSDGVLLFKAGIDSRTGYERMIKFANHRGLDTQVVIEEETADNKDYIHLLHKSGVKT